MTAVVPSVLPSPYSEGLGVRQSPRKSRFTRGALFEAAEFALCCGPDNCWPGTDTGLFTFELSFHESPHKNVEYNYVANSPLPRPDLHRLDTPAVWAAAEPAHLLLQSPPKRLPPQHLPYRGCPRSRTFAPATYPHPSLPIRRWNNQSRASSPELTLHVKTGTPNSTGSQIIVADSGFAGTIRGGSNVAPIPQSPPFTCHQERTALWRRGVAGHPFGGADSLCPHGRSYNAAQCPSSRCVDRKTLFSRISPIRNSWRGCP